MPSRSFLSPRAIGCAAGLIALVDLTTSAVPSFIDVFGPVPTLPTWVRVLEAVCVLGLAPLLPGAFRATRSLIERLPGSRLGHGLLLSYLVGTCVAVLLRTELYPFSNVGMFSAVPTQVDPHEPRTEPSVVFVSGQLVVPVSTLREGSTLAATLDTGWDYKAGWVMWMFGTTHSHALSHATSRARDNGFARAARALVTFDPMSGRTLNVAPYPPRRKATR